MWQPIETAPTDGTPFQAWLVRGLSVADGWWEPRCRFVLDDGEPCLEVFQPHSSGRMVGEGEWLYDETAFAFTCLADQPLATHWMPLPNGPQAS